MGISEVVLKGKTGSPVTGVNEFFNREKELRILLEKIIRGESIYIAAPRRIGKTSLMHKVKQCLEDQGHICLFHDLEGGAAPSDLVAVLYEDMTGKANLKEIKPIAKNFIKNLWTSLGSRDSTERSLLKGFLDSTLWRQNGDHFFETMVGSCPEGKRLIIFLDELALMIQKMQECQTEECRHVQPHGDVETFLAWLRSIQQRFSAKVSFVVASSIGLPPLLHRLGLSQHMNAFVSFNLDAWTPEVARECIFALGRGASLEFSEEVVQRMMDLIGWCSPYYVQVFVDAVRDHHLGQACTCEEVEIIYKKHVVRGTLGIFQLSHMEERLRKSFAKKEYDLAMNILSSAAQSCDGVQESSLDEISANSKAGADSLRAVLDVLEHDGYLERNGNEWRFLSKLLRDWWLGHYRVD